jgi:CheY-like chemotaxis protein
MVIILERAGYRVVRARHGGEALERVREHMPDLIVLDMKMPRMNGWEFARAYHADYPPEERAPVVVVTAAEHAAARAQEIAAEGYLAKPFTQTELLAEIERHLAAPRAATP